MTREEAVSLIEERIRVTEYVESSYVDCVDIEALKMAIEALRQPEQRCLNCGRTANNGGWYEDGRTRCPIEEHYALPKDGYCHLWEKEKVWEDDYVKKIGRRSDGRFNQ